MPYYQSKRLQSKISRVRTSKVSMLVAPAGYGKTSAIRSLDLPCLIELRLTEPGTSLTELWGLLVQEAAAYPALCSLLSDLPEPHDLAGLRSVFRALRPGVFSVHEQVYLFVDNAHHALTLGSLTELLDAMEFLAPNIHLIFASRQGILTLSDRMKLGRNLLEVGLVDLRLTGDEIVEYAACEGIELQEDDARRLYRQTEGWIGCLCGILREHRETGVLRDCEEYVANLIAELVPLSSIDERLAVLGLPDIFDAALACRLWSELEKADARREAGADMRVGKGPCEDGDETASPDAPVPSGSSGSSGSCGSPGSCGSADDACHPSLMNKVFADAAIRAYEAKIGFVERVSSATGGAVYRLHRGFRQHTAMRFDGLSPTKQQVLRKALADWSSAGEAPSSLPAGCAAAGEGACASGVVSQEADSHTSSAARGTDASVGTFPRSILEPDDLRGGIFDLLNSREREMVALALRRCTNAEIARHLNLSESVVKLYFNRVYTKLNIEGSVRGKRLALERLVAEEL